MNDSKSIEAYIKAFPNEIATALQHVYQAIKETLPDAEEAISYGLPTFKINGKNIVHFGGFKTHIGFYPTPGGITKFQEGLLEYKSAKGSVQFPLNKPMPLRLIRQITLYRMQQVKEKEKKK